MHTLSIFLCTSTAPQRSCTTSEPPTIPTPIKLMAGSAAARFPGKLPCVLTPARVATMRGALEPPGSDSFSGIEHQGERDLSFTPGHPRLCSPLVPRFHVAWCRARHGEAYLHPGLLRLPPGVERVQADEQAWAFIEVIASQAGCLAIEAGTGGGRAQGIVWHGQILPIPLLGVATACPWGRGVSRAHRSPPLGGILVQDQGSSRDCSKSRADHPEPRKRRPHDGADGRRDQSPAS